MSEFTLDQLYCLDTLGLFHYKGFLSKEKVDKINALLDKHIMSLDPIPSKYTFFELDPIFVDIMSSPWIVDACRRVLGNFFRLDHCVGIQQPGHIKSSKTGTWVEQGHRHGNLHGGLHASQGSCFYQAFNDGTIWSGQISVGISLIGQSEETGGFCYIPGSHKQYNPWNGADIFSKILGGNYRSQCIKIPNLEPGDLVFFSESLMHGTTPIKEGSVRRAIYYKYVPGFICWRPYDEISHYSKLAQTDLQRRILRPPFVGEILDRETARMSDNHYRQPT